MEEWWFSYSVQDGQTHSKNSFNCQGDRICLTTGDSHCISVDKEHGNILLREKKLSDKTCVFRKKVLETKSSPNGRVETVVFALDCHQDFYLTMSSRGNLELIFQTSIPRVHKQDESIFALYFTKVGHVLIQPKLHANMYLHHRDQVLNVLQFDLNERCPEEYFFHLDAIPEYPEQNMVNKKIPCPDIPYVKYITCNMCAVTNEDTAIAIDIVVNSVKQERQISGTAKLSLRESAKTRTPLSVLFYGCFSNFVKQVSHSK